MRNNDACRHANTQHKTAISHQQQVGRYIYDDSKVCRQGTVIDNGKESMHFTEPTMHAACMRANKANKTDIPVHAKFI